LFLAAFRTGSQRMSLIWIDGQLVARDQARVSVFDHGLLYGDGVFEGIRQYSGRVFREADHLRRLMDSAKAIRLNIDYNQSDISAAIHETLLANKLTESYIRLVITRGVGPLGVSPLGCGKPSMIIIADSIQLYPRELYLSGMAIITARTIRMPGAALSPKIKSLNYLNNIMAKWEAIDAGVPEAVMINHRGFVSECTAVNIFIVRRGELYTPSDESDILLGVTRAVVIELATAAGIRVHQENIRREDLYAADECFLTGTGAEVIPVTSIDRKPIGGGKVGPVAKRLMEAFHDYVRAGEPAAQQPAS
jgi:branched-chain amino acid aminotransferase